MVNYHVYCVTIECIIDKHNEELFIYIVHLVYDCNNRNNCSTCHIALDHHLRTHTI